MAPIARLSITMPLKTTGARKPTFTPTNAEVNTDGGAFEANCINVTATYTDGYNDDPENPTANAPLPQAADNPVLPKRQANRAPKFENEDGDAITSTTRSVDEDATMVGAAVSAVDPDDAGNGPDGNPDIPLRDNLTYSLHGTDRASFTINDGTGQITAKSDTLDYETKKTHSVIVRATDGSRATANISVTINVTDVNEEPDVNGPAEATFAENGMGDVGTYTADDPRERRGCLELERHRRREVQHPWWSALLQEPTQLRHRRGRRREQHVRGNGSRHRHRGQRGLEER